MNPNREGSHSIKFDLQIPEMRLFSVLGSSLYVTNFDQITLELNWEMGLQKRGLISNFPVRFGCQINLNLPRQRLSGCRANVISSRMKKENKTKGFVGFVSRNFLRTTKGILLMVYDRRKVRRELAKT